MILKEVAMHGSGCGRYLKEAKQVTGIGSDCWELSELIEIVRPDF